MIFAGSSIPGQDFPDLTIFTYDKLIHFVLYFVFSLLIYRALRFQTKIPVLSKYAVWISLFLAVLYAASDEYHQSFVSGRSSDPFDWLADSLGGSFFVLVTYIRSKMARNGVGQKKA